MNNIEEYQNLIGLMKKALEFYADPKNYEGECEDNTPIVADELGSQARFVLEKLEQLENLNKVMEDEYTKDVTDKDVLNAIEEFKKTVENFGNKL
jgi:cytochrome c peroxidase